MTDPLTHISTQDIISHAIANLERFQAAIESRLFAPDLLHMHDLMQRNEAKRVAIKSYREAV